MDRQTSSDKPKFSKASLGKYAKLGGGVIVLAGAFFAFKAGYRPVTAKSDATSKSEVTEAPKSVTKSQNLFDRYVAAWNSTEDKVDEVRRALEENDRLRYENSNLRLKLETAQFDCHEKEAVTETKKISAKSADETGSRVARTLANIAYKPPSTLLPNQLYTLGVTYFKSHEDEKAAVIFSFLTNLDDNTAFYTARNFVLTGVAWYRVDNFEMADLYFDRALKEPEAEGNLQFQAQARLWKGLVSQRLGKDKDTQHWLRELVDHHPHSLEAQWVNGANSMESKEDEAREPATSKE